MAEVIAALRTLGYHETLDQRPTRFELQARDGSCVDLHALDLDPTGDARQRAPDGSWRHIRSADNRGRPRSTAARARSARAEAIQP